MGLHECRKTGIVNLFSFEGVYNDELSPDRVHCGGFVNQRKARFDTGKPSFGLRNTQAQSAPSSCGTRADVPELGGVLNCERELIPASTQEPHRGVDG